LFKLQLTEANVALGSITIRVHEKVILIIFCDCYLINNCVVDIEKQEVVQYFEAL
jgi:hypothetical protein